MAIRFYRVGGCVRDALMGIKPDDIDYACDAPSFEAMRADLLAHGAKLLVENPEHLRIKAKLASGEVADFVPFRKDGTYSDGRRPDSVEIGTLESDLARRDFTMNAIAEDCKDGTLIDPHGGRDDIKFKIIKCVGNADERMAEDLIRPFRAIRFAVQKGFTIHEATYNAIIRIAPSKFSGVSTERITGELFKMFRVDSFDSFHLLFEKFPNLGEVVRERGVIWFKPTMGKM